MSETSNITIAAKIQLDRNIGFGVIGLLALLSNVALCTVLLRNRQMLQRAYNIIIFALAIADTLTGMVLLVVSVLLRSRPDKGEANGIFKVVQLGYLEFAFGEISILLIMCLTLERWFAVFRPIQYRYKFRKSRIYLYLFFILIITIATKIHFALPGYDRHSTSSVIVAIINTTVSTFFPLLVTWCTYVHLWLHCKKAPTIQQTNSRNLKQKLLRMCTITALFLTVCWLPADIYYSLNIWGFTSHISSIYNPCDMLAMSNSIVNPWVYYFTNLEYKKAFKRLFSDIILPLQYMLQCCQSTSLRATEDESHKGKGGAVPSKVI